MDVPIDKAMVLWTRNTNRVCVVDISSDDPRKHDKERYRFSDGSCWIDYRNANADEQLGKLYRIAMTMMIRDNVPPACVHNAYLSIKRYRDICPEDCAGLLPVSNLEWSGVP